MKVKHPERAERLREFFNRLNIKNVTLASKLGIKPAFVSQLLNKHSTVTTDVALWLVGIGQPADDGAVHDGNRRRADV